MESAGDAGALLHLSDTDLALENPVWDVRGRKVLDADGEEIGEVDDLLIDAAERRVRFLQVSSGGFLGLGETRFLIPSGAVDEVTPEHVRVGRHREHVAAAPRYDPTVVDEHYLADLHGYYQMPPYWGPAYMRGPYF
ncbi:MAG TPA: PRC-barrel domain-containing protein [Gemmatimonadales bacterium]|nr:PRC-barrel domain-containing protein [Gemmatimonadales bacterium]